MFLTDFVTKFGLAIPMFWQLDGTVLVLFVPKCNVNVFLSISVACGNSSAPGPREDSLHAKICKKFDTRVNAGVFFYKFLP